MATCAPASCARNLRACVITILILTPFGTTPREIESWPQSMVDKRAGAHMSALSMIRCGIRARPSFTKPLRIISGEPVGHNSLGGRRREQGRDKPQERHCLCGGVLDVCRGRFRITARLVT